MTLTTRPLLCALLLAFGVGSGCGGGHKEPTYEDIANLVETTCATSSACHAGEKGQATLNFGAALEAGTPITELLNGVPACEYDAWPRVDPGNPEGSWIMIKLGGPYSEDGHIQFDPDPGWDPGLTPDADGNLPQSTCPLTENGELSFGLVMPLNPLAPTPLDPKTVDMIREWIELGAPGPGGS